MGSLKKNKFTIALIIPGFAGGGAERAVQTIGGYYYGKGYRVLYFLLDNSRRCAYEIKGQVVRLGIDLNGRGINPYIRAARIMRRAKKQYEIDIAISFMEESNFLNVLSRGKEKTILSVRTTLSARSDLTGTIYNAKWIGFFYNQANSVVSVSKYVKNDLIKNYGIRERKICVISNPALVHDGIGENAKWEYGDNVIICVGRLEPIKQQDRIIRAFSYVKSCCPKAKLLLLGDGKLKNYLEKICVEFGVKDEVFIKGFTSAPGYYLRNSRVFVMTSKSEGFPNAMVEAMACGVPVVSTDSPGGCGEIVGRELGSDEIQYCKYGILTPHMSGRVKIKEPLKREEILLGKAIISVLEDDRIYREYSKRSMKRAEHYAMQNVMNKWDKVLGIDRHQ